MLPATRPAPDDFTAATWADIEPRFDALAEEPLDLTNVEAWLEAWSDLEIALTEAIERASVAYTVDTTDPVAEEAYNRFSGEIQPKMAEQRVRLSERLLDLGYTRDDLDVAIRKFRNQREIYRPENVPLIQDLQPLDARYQRITGEMTAEWDGQVVALAQLKPYLQNPDRATRERAYRLMLAPYIEQRDALADVFDEQYAMRQQIAHNAGFADFRDFMFQEKNRFDYTPADCEAFHDAVEATVVPALAKRYERRRRLLGV